MIESERAAWSHLSLAGNTESVQSESGHED
jgi:hypothetical protein